MTGFLDEGSNPSTSKKFKNIIKKPLANNQIRAKEVRLIDETGKQIGVLPLEKALQIARERNFDLVQVTEKVEPPVCKLMDYGKYLYSLQKKERKARLKMKSEIKGIRLGFNISLHDMETKAKMAEKFLKKGNKVRIEMRLIGREKGLLDFAEEKMKKFLALLEELIPIKIERELKREPRGLTIIISKK